MRRAKRAPPRLMFAQFICGHMQPLGAGKVGRLLYPYDRAKRDGYRFRIPSKTGSTFIGSAADFHAYPFAVNGYSDWRQWAVALAVCQPGDLIVEVGANVGSETVGFSDIVGASGRVIAFEPLPSNLAALEAVVRGLRYGNVTLLPHALSDRADTVAFAVPAASMSQGIGHVLGPDERTTGITTYHDTPIETAVIHVESRMLDEFAAEVDGLRLLVADVEGSEVPTLRGARNVLEAQRPVLVLEASKAHQRRAGFGIDQLHDELHAIGYTPYEITTLGVEKVTDPLAGPPHSDWVCFPQASLGLVARVRSSIRRCALMPCALGLNPLTSPRRLARTGAGRETTPPAAAAAPRA